MPETTTSATGVFSNRFETGMIAIVGAIGRTTEPVVAQKGQTCESQGCENRSAQK